MGEILEKSDKSDQLATIEWCEERWADSSNYRDMKRYEICESIRIIFSACVGGWASPQLWVGKEQRCKPTVGKIKKLCDILDIDCEII